MTLTVKNIEWNLLTDPKIRCLSDPCWQGASKEEILKIIAENMALDIFFVPGIWHAAPMFIPEGLNEHLKNAFQIKDAIVHRAKTNLLFNDP